MALTKLSNALIMRLGYTNKAKAKLAAIIVIFFRMDTGYKVDYQQPTFLAHFFTSRSGRV